MNNFNPQMAQQPMGGAMAQPQGQQRDMFAPDDGPGVEEQLAIFRAQFSQEKEAMAAKDDTTDDSFLPKDALKTETSKEAQYTQWLTPVATQTNLPSRMPIDHSSKHYQHFEENFSGDPAVQELYPHLKELGDRLLEQVQQQVSQGVHPQDALESAKQQAADLLTEYGTPILDKHHGSNKEERSSREKKFLLPVDKLTGMRS